MKKVKTKYGDDIYGYSKQYDSIEQQSERRC